MLPLEHQKRISQLRDKYRSPDSTPFIDAIEKDLIELYKEKKILKNPAFEKFVEIAENTVNNLTILLESDEKMWSEEGKQVAREREVYRGILNAFGVDYKDRAIKNLVESIDVKLEE